MSDTSRTLEIVLQFRDKLTAGTMKALSGIKGFATKATAALNWITKSVFSIKTALVGLGAYLVGRFVAGTVKSVAELGRQFVSWNLTTGLSVQTLSELRYIAQQNGVTFEDMTASITSLQKNFEAFNRGGGEAKAILARMSDEFREAVRAGAPMERLLPMLADEFKSMGSEQERLFAAMKLFEERGVKMVGFLTQGKEGFEALRKESHQLLTTWTDLEAKAGDKFVSAFDKLKTAIGGVIDTGIKALLPTLTEWMEKLVGVIVKGQPEILDFFATLLKAAAIALPRIESAVISLTTALWELLKPIMQMREWLVKKDLELAAENLRQIEERYRATPSWALPFPTGRPRANPIEEARWEEEKKAARALLAAKQAEMDDIQAMKSGRPVGGGISGGMAAGLDAASASVAAMAAQKRAAQAAGESGAPAAAAAADAVVNSTKRTYSIISSEYDKMISGMKDGVMELKDKWSDTYSLMKSMVGTLADSITDNLTAALEDTMDGVKKAEDAFRDMAVAVLKDLRHELLRYGIKQVFRAALDAVGGGMRMGGIATPDLPSPLVFKMQAAATGMARTTGPTIAGEAGPEAVIPLPDGRHVPVEMRGKGQTVINYYHIEATDAESFDRKLKAGMHRQRGDFASLMASEFQSRPTVRRRYA